MEAKPICKYGANCFRKNAEHLRRFSHPHKDNESPLYSAGQEQISKAESPPVSKRARQDDVIAVTSSLTEAASSIVNSDQCQKQIMEQFLVNMPEDFIHFWEFCKSLNPSQPTQALKPTLKLELVGPFHVLGGFLTDVPWQQCVLHYRYFYDPPEFVTVLCSDDDRGFHLGYYRDDPKSLECLVVSNCANIDCQFKVEGNTLFSVIRGMLKENLEDNFNDLQLQHIEVMINKKVEELHLDMREPKGLSLKRNREINAKCFHKIGISVPFNKSTEVGYRPLPVTDGELRKTLDRISSCTVQSKRASLMEPLQEIITYVQFANDECDYGMGLELGLDLFMHGDQFHSHVLSLLPLAYELLGRDEYARIIKEHVNNRSRTPLNFCTSRSN